MVVFIQLLVVFSVVIQLIDSETIPDNVIHKLVTNAIRAHDLTPLVGKCCRHHSSAEDIVQKRVHVKYNHERAETSILSDRAGAVPQFAAIQFERAFRIKLHMVNVIMNSLACYNTFWINTVCRADKGSISPYLKFLIAKKMLCFGISASAFMDYFQWVRQLAKDVCESWLMA
jgi:hypothetical protein